MREDPEEMPLVICPHNVYTAMTQIENSTIIIHGPMNCTIPFISKTSLISQLKDRWIISSGGSTHWGASMNLLQMLMDDIPFPTPASAYGKSVSSKDITTQPPPDVIELEMKHDGNYVIRVMKDVRNYTCGDPGVHARFTVLQSPFMSQSAERFQHLVQECVNHPKIDLVVDVSGRWYDYCRTHLNKKGFAAVCKRNNITSAEGGRETQKLHTKAFDSHNQDSQF